jgi:hypothetical protein
MEPEKNLPFFGLKSTHQVQFMKRMLQFSKKKRSENSINCAVLVG